MGKKFILPLANVHTHAAMVAFRGIVQDVTLEEWLTRFIFPAETARVNSQFVYEQTKNAIREMKKNGVKVFCDMYFFEQSVADAAQEMKMNAVIGEVILDCPTPSAKTPEEALETTEKLLDKYKNDSYISVAVAPHSIYTVSAGILSKAKKLAVEHGAIYHLHLAETKTEFDNCLKYNKLTPVGYADKLGLLDEKTLLAHCVWVTDGDMEILSKRKTSVAHCPLSNLKLGSGMAPVAKMVDKGINVAIGTDGAASSDRLDVWEAGKIAALLQKGLTHDPTVIPAKDAIRMMTTNGLKALGIKRVGEMSLPDIENEISKANFDFLYELNVDELNFC